MEPSEFGVEWERAALSWGKDPDSKLMGKIRARWAKGFLRDTQSSFRVAIDRLVGQQPLKFPTFGQVKAELRSFRSAFGARTPTYDDYAAEDAALTPADLRALAEDLAEEVEDHPCSDRRVTEFQSRVYRYLLDKAEAKETGAPMPRKPRVDEVLGAVGARIQREPGMEG